MITTGAVSQLSQATMWGTEVLRNRVDIDRVACRVACLLVAHTTPESAAKYYALGLNASAPFFNTLFLTEKIYFW